VAEWRSIAKKRLSKKQDSNESVLDLPLFYDIHIFCCVNERPPKHRRGCCSGKSALLLCDYMCRRTMAMGLKDIRVNRAGCLNRCELGPVMVIYPEGIWYSYASEEDIDEIVRAHIIGGQPVQRLLLTPDQGPRH
jgi:(2Fe-2S) ferredoxin